MRLLVWLGLGTVLFGTTLGCTLHTTCANCVAATGCVWNNCNSSCATSIDDKVCSSWTRDATMSHSCACSPNVLVGSQGAFDDGSGLANYQNNLDCRYLIAPATPPTYDVTFIQFESFNLESYSPTSLWDYVNVSSTATSYNMLSPSTPTQAVALVGSQTTVPRFLCTSNQDSPHLVIDFISDDSISKDGWQATYGSYNFGSSYCCGEWKLTAFSGTFTDGSPANYLSTMKCSFLIIPSGPESTYTFDIHFSDFELASTDSVLVYSIEAGSGISSLSKTLTGRGSQYVCIEAAAVRVVFDVSGSVGAPGFTARYEVSNTTNGCGVVCAPRTVLGTSSGVLTDSTTTLMDNSASIKATRNCEFDLHTDATKFDFVELFWNFTVLGTSSSINIKNLDPVSQAVTSQVAAFGTSVQGVLTCSSSPAVSVGFASDNLNVAGFYMTYAGKPMPHRTELQSTLSDFFGRFQGISWRTATNWLSDVSICAWHGVTCECGTVTSISLASNFLTGTNLSSIAEKLVSIPTFATLRQLDLSDNTITGTIPDILGGLTALEQLDLSRNRLTGTIPPSLAIMPVLKRLSVSNNLLTGELPVLWNSLLGSLDISNNPLSGTLPPVLTGGQLELFQCSQTYIYSGSTCAPYRAPLCGDGIVSKDPSCANSEICCGVAGEECDDGNTQSSDGCSSTCHIESGYNCEQSPSTCDLVTCFISGTSGSNTMPTVQNGSCLSIPNVVMLSNFTLAIESSRCGRVVIEDSVTLESVVHVTSSLEILSAGAQPVSIIAAAGSRHFIVHSGASVQMNNIVLVDGSPIDALGGGSIYVQSYASLQLISSVVKNNHASFGAGGAVFGAEHSKVVISRTTFSNNSAQATSGGGAVFAFGGAQLADSESTVVDSCLFEGNTPDQVRLVGSGLMTRSSFDCGGATHISLVPGPSYNGSEQLFSSSSNTAKDCIMFILPGGNISAGTYEQPYTSFSAAAVQSVISGLDIVFLGDHTVTHPMLRAIQLASLANITIRGGLDDQQTSPRLRFAGTGGLFIWGVTNMNISHLEISASLDQVSSSTLFVAGATNVNFVDISFRDYTKGFVLSTSGSTVNLLGCTFSNIHNFEPACSDSCPPGSSLQVWSDGGAGMTTVVDSTFENCTAFVGGAIFATANLTLERVQLTNNRALMQGGAIYASQGVLHVIGTTFENNTAFQGGAISASESRLIVQQNSVFRDNTAQSGGGAIRAEEMIFTTIKGATFERNSCWNSECSGGALNMIAGNVDIQDSTFEHNTAVYGGAASLAGCLGFRSDCNTSISRCVISSNYAAGGGGLYISEAASLWVDSTEFVANRVSSTGAGGAIATHSKTLTFINNSQFKDNAGGQRGGGVLADDAVYCVITNSTFERNFAETGGGLCIGEDCSTKVQNCSFIANQATSSGGGVRADGRSTLFMNASLLLNNMAANGGGVHTSTGFLATIAASNFTDNSAVSGDGGGVLMFSSFVMITSSTFEKNTAFASGGAVSSFLSSPWIFNDSFVGNSAHSGGAVYAMRGSVQLNSSVFIANSANDFGGGLFLTVSTLSSDSVLFESNTATTGGAMSGFDNTESVQLQNVRFFGNSATDGGAIAFLSSNLELDRAYLVSNRASVSGGALHLSSCQASLTSTEGRDNTANSGGFLWMQVVRAKLENTVLRSNRATTEGGAICSLSTRSLSLVETELRQNLAETGGAVYLSATQLGATNVSLANVQCFENMAASSGGCLHVVAVGADGCKLTISDSQFQNNSAGGFGGGICASEVSSLAVSQSSVEWNSVTASTGIEADFPGGGGLWFNSIGHLVLNHSTISSNTVGSGGNGAGAFVLLASSTSDVIFDSMTFAQNSVPTGGGGAVFWAGQSDPPAVVVMKHEDNVALYGNLMASSPRSLVISKPLDSKTKYYGRGDVLPGGIEVSLIDYYKNIVESESSRFARCSLRADSQDFGVVGADIVQFASGRALFTSVGVVGNAGESVVLVFNLLGENVDNTNATQLVLLSYELQYSGAVLVFSLGAVSVAICFLLAIFVHKNRAHSAIKKSSPKFCHATILGGLIGSSTVFYFTSFDSDAACNAAMWHVSIGISLLFGSLFVKKYRIWRIFINPKLKIQRNLEDKRLFGWLALLLTIDLVCLTTQTALGKTRSSILRSATGYAHHACQVAITPQMGILFAFKAVMVVAGCGLTFATRNVTSAYNESRSIGLSIYNLLFFSIFMLVSIGTMGGKFEYWKAMELCLMLGIVFAFIFSLFLLFAIKLEVVLWPSVLAWIGSMRGRMRSKATTADSQSKSEMWKQNSTSESSHSISAGMSWVFRAEDHQLSKFKPRVTEMQL